MAGKAIGLIIARMSSSRLPGKVLRPLVGRPLLDFTLERLQTVTGLSEFWLATTSHTSDEPLVAWAKAHGLNVMAYDGDTQDVVGRISAVLTESGADEFIAVLGDTPFVDARLLNNMRAAMAQNDHWETIGVDQSDGPCVHGGILCYRTPAWQRLDAASNQPMYREHAGSILRDTPDLVFKGQICDDPLYYSGPYRLTVDTAADFELASRIADALYQPGEVFPLSDVLNYLQDRPELAQMNQHVRQKSHDESPKSVLIAAQAGGHFGLGHLSRCKTIGKALKEQFSADVTFWLDTPNETLAESLAEEGWRVAPKDLSLSDTLKKGTFERLVIDFQDRLTLNLMKDLRQVWPEGAVVVLDNNGDGCKLADTVVFPNAHAHPDPAWGAQHRQVYQGPDYILLGASFLAEARREPEPTDQPNFVLITMGGVDPHLLTEHTLKSLKQLSGCHIDVVVPPLYPSPEDLEALATSLPSTITLHWKRTNLRPLMQRATVAIAAFGVTAYELAYMAVPTILVGHDDSQLDDMARFAAFGSAVTAGAGESIHPERLYETLWELLEQPERRAVMSQNGHALVPDEHGALRVAERILATLPQAVRP